MVFSTPKKYFLSQSWILVVVKKKNKTIFQFFALTERTALCLNKLSTVVLHAIQYTTTLLYCGWQFFKIQISFKVSSAGGIQYSAGAVLFPLESLRLQHLAYWWK